jgi:hypothetical protein
MTAIVGSAPVGTGGGFCGKSDGRAQPASASTPAAAHQSFMR